MITLLATFIGYLVLTAVVGYGAWGLYCLATGKIKYVGINTNIKGSN